MPRGQDFRERHRGAAAHAALLHPRSDPITTRFSQSKLKRSMVWEPTGVRKGLPGRGVMSHDLTSPALGCGSPSPEKPLGEGGERPCEPVGQVTEGLKTGSGERWPGWLCGSSIFPCAERSRAPSWSGLIQVEGLQPGGGNLVDIFPSRSPGREGLLPERDVFLLIPALGLQSCPQTPEEEGALQSPGPSVSSGWILQSSDIPVSRPI